MVWLKKTLKHGNLKQYHTHTINLNNLNNSQLIWSLIQFFSHRQDRLMEVVCIHHTSPAKFSPFLLTLRTLFCRVRRNQLLNWRELLGTSSVMSASVMSTPMMSKRRRDGSSADWKKWRGLTVSGSWIYIYIHNIRICIYIYPSKIEWDLNNGPLSKLLELLDTQV